MEVYMMKNKLKMYISSSIPRLENKAYAALWIQKNADSSFFEGFELNQDIYRIILLMHR